jgi:hypothetical protein
MSAAQEAARDWRLAGMAGWALVAAALAALGWLWHVDRARIWDTPELGAPLVRLGAAPADTVGDTGPAVDTWLVAVNPDCPHCLQALAALRARPRRGVRVGALIVDTPRRPGAASLAALGAVPLWWDERGAWRRRWGHRVYGEVLCFDRQGRYLRTRLPD